ncbi:chemotaxis protein [Cystobacter fuscus]|uniref:Chemotaxis protein n=1 Tax=Cystobacter fuscus TaxID=43 RepID=A0A250IV25_9BACT|nr:chemotaxis protein [Cystobacter fuscus]ATB35090.1 chemotaxis protein [Cystobacter fuscus]
MRPLSRLPRPLLALPLLVLMAACASVQRRSPLMERVGRSDMSVGALRIHVRDMARRFPVMLEAVADDVARLSGSAEMREAMLRAKSSAVPAMQAALLQPDPVAALIDGWALLVQIEQALPAAGSPDARAAARQPIEKMESEMEALWRKLSGSQDVSRLRELIQTWAAEHPLTGPLLVRESTVPLLAAFTDRSGVGLLGATANLLQDTQDVFARMDAYTDSLPRQARWQAELAVQEMVEGTPVLTSAMAELERAVDVLVRVGALAGDTPAVVAREREALQDFISSERLAVLDGVRGERVAVLDALHTERVEALAQTDAMGRGWVDQAFDRAEALVDHIFLWLLGLVLLFVLGVLVAAALLAWAWRRGERLPVGRSRGRVSPVEPHAGDTRVHGPEPSHESPGEHPGEPHH